MPRHKPLPAAEPKPSVTPAASNAKWVAVASLFGVTALVVLLWSTGFLTDLFAGPKIPIPRDDAGFTFGTTQEELLAKYPSAKKKFRLFNDDPNFNIVDLDAQGGLSGPSSAELLFFKDHLYFISVSWEGSQTQSIPIADWAHQYRRWLKGDKGGSEPLGSDVTLKTWHFNDGATEMTLRDLDYPSHLQRWEDLRDVSNQDAQSAFAKYQIDQGS